MAHTTHATREVRAAALAALIPGLLFATSALATDGVSTPTDAARWSHLIFAASLLISAGIVSLRSTFQESARVLALGFGLMGVAELGAAAGGVAGAWFDIMGGIGTGAAVWFCTLFPPELPRDERLSPWWGALAGALDSGVRVVVVSSLHHRLGVAPEQLVLVADACVITIVFAIMTRNYARARQLGRRRMRWLLIGSLLGLGPYFIVAIASLVIPDITTNAVFLAMTYASGLFTPIAVLIAMVADDLFEVDGDTKILITLAIPAGLILATLLAALVRAPSDPASSLIAGALAMLGGWALVKWLYPALVARFVPERGRFQRAADTLRDAVAREDSPAQLVRNLLHTLDTIFLPEYAHAYLFDEQAERFSLTATITGAATRALDESKLPAPLLDSEALLCVVPHRTRRRAATLFLGLHAHGVLRGVLEVGPKRSRAPYTPEEEVFLRALALQGAAAMQRYEDQQTIRHQRALVHTLRHAQNTQPPSPELAGLQHDMRQPVESIRLLSELLRASAQDPGTRTIAEYIHTSAHSLRDTLDDGLSGQTSSAYASFPLDRMTRRLQAIFSPMAEAKGVALTLDLPPQQQVRTSEVLLERVLANLISNALRYTTRGHVLVAASCVDGLVVLRVSDTGPGLDPARLEEAMRPHTQLDNGAEEGLGLGLSIVRQLTTQLGILLDIDTSPGEGTTFILTLPEA